MENFELIKQSYDKYIQLLKRFFPESPEAIEKLENEFGDRMFLAPRGLSPDQGGVPGGLVSFAFATAKHAKIFDGLLDQKKLVRVALIHELGKLGGRLSGQELFVSEPSDWHREKLGRDYKYNEDCPKMSVAHRTLFYCAYLGFSLDEEEWLALLTSSGFQYDENKFYANECLPLAQALHTCRTFATQGLLESKNS